MFYGQLQLLLKSYGVGRGGLSAALLAGMRMRRIVMSVNVLSRGATRARERGSESESERARARARESERESEGERERERARERESVCCVPCVQHGKGERAAKGEGHCCPRCECLAPRGDSAIP